MIPPDSDIVLSFEGRMPGGILEEFSTSVAAEGLKLVLDERPTTRAFAGIEWLMPTALLAYVAKPYFESFLTEAGKDHYNLVKAGLKVIAQKVRAISMARLGTPGKVRADFPYSMIFSVYFDRDEGGNFKFLIPNDVSETELDAAMEAGLTFIEDYRWKRLEESLFEQVSVPPRAGRTVLLAYDPAARTVKVVDPLEGFLPPNSQRLP